MPAKTKKRKPGAKSLTRRRSRERRAEEKLETLLPRRRRRKATKRRVPKAVYVGSRQELREYLASHLTPVDHGPKGQPIYAAQDLMALNVRIRTSPTE